MTNRERWVTPPETLSHHGKDTPVQHSRLTVGEAREQFAEALNQLAYAGKRIVIERRGKEVAAMVPIEDLELLRALEDRIDLDAARAALVEVETEGTTSWRELKADLGL